MDIFEKWLEKNMQHIALTDRSYRSTHLNECKDVLPKKELNTELATYGDAVLKLALCKILYGTTEDGLSEAKKKYETDEVLVRVIARHYKILDILRFDKDDGNMPQDYDYKKESSKKESKHKYIATAVEACLGAIWEERHDFKKICDIVEKWKSLIDQAGSKDPNP